MKISKIIPFLVLLFAIENFNCQTQRFIYRLTYKIDSISDDAEEMDMILDVGKEYTKFFPKEFVEIDSLNNVSDEKMSTTTPRSLNLLLKRKRNSGENINYVFVDRDYFNYISSDKINWELINETKKENDYLLQKAICKFGGRNWTAWFCGDIPVFEGPYKFYGLPGLIFSVEDDNKNFKFSLIEIKNLKKSYDTKNILETNFGTQSIKINLVKFKKLLMDYYQNPYKDFQNRDEGSWYINTESGKTIKNKSDLMELTKQMQSTIKKYYNPIELNNAVHYP
jgi:GLPGLI family protein